MEKFEKNDIKWYHKERGWDRKLDKKKVGRQKQCQNIFYSIRQRIKNGDITCEDTEYQDIIYISKVINMANYNNENKVIIDCMSVSNEILLKEIENIANVFDYKKDKIYKEKNKILFIRK